MYFVGNVHPQDELYYRDLQYTSKSTHLAINSAQILLIQGFAILPISQIFQSKATKCAPDAGITLTSVITVFVAPVLTYLAGYGKPTYLIYFYGTLILICLITHR